MSYRTFKDDFLVEAQNRVSAINVATATDEELVLGGAIYKMAGAVAEVDLITPQALSLLESMTGVELEAYLQGIDEFQSFLAMVNSSTAMAAVAASSTAMDAVAASSTAMDAVIASSTAMDSMMSSQTARVALFNSAQAQYSFRSSATALAYFDTIKTSLSISAIYNDYTQMTSRNCFMLSHSSVVFSVANKTKNYKHLTDGITGVEMVGNISTANLNNRFMSGLYIYLFENASGSVARTADIVYFD